MRTFLSRDALRQATVGNVRGMPGSSLATSFDGRITHISSQELPPSRTPRPLAVKPDGTVAYSTILGEIPTIDSTPINDDQPPALTIPTTGLAYVRVTVTGVFNVEDSIFVHPNFTSITSIEISIESTASTGADLISSTGEFHFDLAFIVAGRIDQSGYGPISGTLIDDLTESATAGLFLAWGGG